MKTIVRIYKAVLLWMTVLSFLLFIMALDSMITEGRWTLVLAWVAVNCLFYWMCRSLLTVRDLYKLSGNYYLDKYLK